MQPWYVLDNAARVYPSLYNKDNPNTFRLSALLYEDIDGKILQDALNSTLLRLESFNVVIKKGLFWYYYDKNNKKCLVQEESPFIFHATNFRKKNGFLFHVSYIGKRINLEIFHALTDATGATEFIKTLCFYYLKYSDKEVVNDGSIITDDVEFSPLENEESFVEHYTKEINKIKKYPKAFLLKGTKCDDRRLELINGMMSVSELKNITKRYKCTITEYLGGVLLYSIYLNSKDLNKKKLPITLLVPVNARKILNSITLRNFMLYIRSSVDVNNEVTLDVCIKCMKNTLSGELTVDYLKSIIKLNVPLQKNIAVRLMPLFIKTHFIRAGFKMFGLNTSTLCLSNYGEVITPDCMKQYLDRFEFTVAPCPVLPVFSSVISYNDKLVISFAKSIKERAIMQTFFSLLSKEIKIVIDTNDLVVKK